MAISQLPTLCWTLAPPRATPDGSSYLTGEHWPSPDAAMADGQRAEAVAPGTWACWTVCCNTCGEWVPVADVTGQPHYLTRLDAERDAVYCGWRVLRDGTAWCPEDAPECATADLAVTEQVPGQLTIDEVAGA
jgi:hypothetical protein